MIHYGKLIIAAPALTEVTGGLDIREGTTLTAPVLQRTGGLDIGEGATLTAPQLNQERRA